MWCESSDRLERRQATRHLRSLLLLTVALVATVGIRCPAAWAWGVHNVITKAALEVVPEADHWKQLLGEGNWEGLINYSWLPDQRDEDLGSFYANDYLFIHEMPYHIGHGTLGAPNVRDAYAPYFRRALQALRTETPENACRQMGPLLHFVQDSGAPPHSLDSPYHGPMENWSSDRVLSIQGYQPRLLGQTDDSALAALTARMEEVIAFGAKTHERALPLVSAENPDRSLIEPILLEAGAECARITADLIYTLLTLGLADQPEGAVLEGRVTAPEFPLSNKHGARVALLNAPYATLATTDPNQPANEGWRGFFRFHHLPAGTYRVAVYRTAAQPRVYEDVTLTVGETKILDITLAPTNPAGNIVENPDGRFSYLQPNQPDRWRQTKGETGPAWTSQRVRLLEGHEYRCGAVLRDPEARVRFLFREVPSFKAIESVPDQVVTGGQEGLGEFTVKIDVKRAAVTLVVESAKPLTEAIERVWVVPVEAPQG